MQVDSTVLFKHGEDDTKRLEALRQFGRSLPNTQLYERHAEAILSVLRTRIERHTTGCWSWKGEPYTVIGEKRMKLEPRLLVWVVCAAKDSPSLALWPTCDLKECIRPEHQLEVVPFTTTTVELCFQIGELNEGIVKAALRRGDLRRVESPHHPRAFAIRRDEWEQWLHRPDFEEYLLDLLPFVPLQWQPETYQRRRSAVRGEDTEQIDRMLLFSHSMGLSKVNRDTAIRSLAAFWNQIRIQNNAKFHECWQWLGGNDAPLFVNGQEEPQILVAPDALGWALGTGALPSAPPSQIMHWCRLPHCINPAHGSEVVLEADIPLLFPSNLDEETLDLGIALFEQARKRGTIRFSYWEDKGWAATLADCRAWMRTEGVFSSYVRSEEKNMSGPIDPDQIHQEFSQLQMLADRFSTQFDDLTQGDLGGFLWSASGASAYCEAQQKTLRSLSSELWFLRLALAWDIFPQHRGEALRLCREQLQAVAAVIPEFMQDESSTARKLILPELAEAGELLLRPEEDITTELFIKGVTTLARLVGMCLGQQKEDLSPGQQWWGVTDAMRGLCKRLYALLVPEVMQEADL